MRDRLARCAVSGLLAAVLAVPALAADTEPPPWSERGVFVFGYLTIDFQRHTAVTVPDRSIGFYYGLVNCSNETFYCVKSQHVDLVLPKICAPMKVGDTFSLAGITTTVLAEVPNARAHIGLHSQGPQKQYLLGDDSKPDTVYVYWGQDGVVEIDMGLGWNLVERARHGEPLSDEQHKYTGNGLLTLDAFGPCAPPARH